MPRNCAKEILDEIEYLLPQELQKHKQIRQKFTDEEDKLLINLVGDDKFPNWNEISKSIPNKSSRQCRERFQNYLSPDLSKKPWTKEEDELIISLYKKFGSSWSLIADYFDGKRTNNNIKNRWNSHLKSKFLDSSQINIFNEEENQKIESKKVPNTFSNDKSVSFTSNSPVFNSKNVIYPNLNIFSNFHQKRKQNIFQKLVSMNQEPIIRREVQQKVIRQRQQMKLQNQHNYIENCFDELIDSDIFKQDSFNEFDSIFNETSDLDMFNNSF